MAGGRGATLELGLLAAAALAVGGVLWLLPRWTTLAGMAGACLVVAVAAALAWRSRSPYALLALGILLGAALALAQAYALQRLFAGFCLYEPCSPAPSRGESLLEALPVAVAPVALGALALALLAWLRAPRGLAGGGGGAPPAA